MDLVVAMLQNHSRNRPSILMRLEPALHASEALAEQHLNVLQHSLGVLLSDCLYLTAE
jgi:hypothetical protein